MVENSLRRDTQSKKPCSCDCSCCFCTPGEPKGVTTIAFEVSSKCLLLLLLLSFKVIEHLQISYRPSERICFTHIDWMTAIWEQIVWPRLTSLCCQDLSRSFALLEGGYAGALIIRIAYYRNLCHLKTTSYAYKVQAKLRKVCYGE